MPVLKDLVAECAGLRQQIEVLISQHDYSVEELTSLSEQFQQCLISPVDVIDNTEEYADFLQQNLTWLNHLVTRLTKERDAVAAEMLKIKKGKKAQHSYSQNN